MIDSNITRHEAFYCEISDRAHEVYRNNTYNGDRLLIEMALNLLKICIRDCPNIEKSRCLNYQLGVEILEKAELDGCIAARDGG